MCSTMIMNLYFSPSTYEYVHDREPYHLLSHMAFYYSTRRLACMMLHTSSENTFQVGLEGNCVGKQVEKGQ